jgi:hypothetical protein
VVQARERDIKNRIVRGVRLLWEVDVIVGVLDELVYLSGVA